MKKNLKKMMLGMLVMSMLMSGMLTPNTNTAIAAEEPEKQSVVVSRCITASPFMSMIQYQKFMSYLTQEYAPEIQADWDQAFVERQSIQPDIDVQFEQQVTISADQNIKINCSSTGTDEYLSQTPEIYVTGTSTDTDGDLTAKSFIFNGTASEQEAGVISIAITESPETDENSITQLNLQNELDQAITSNDSKAINTVLGKMLTNYKQITEEIKNNLSKVEVTDK